MSRIVCYAIICIGYSLLVSSYDVPKEDNGYVFVRIFMLLIRLLLMGPVFIIYYGQWMVDCEQHWPIIPEEHTSKTRLQQDDSESDSVTTPLLHPNGGADERYCGMFTPMPCLLGLSRIDCYVLVSIGLGLLDPMFRPRDFRCILLVGFLMIPIVIVDFEYSWLLRIRMQEFDAGLVSAQDQHVVMDKKLGVPMAGASTTRLQQDDAKSDLAKAPLLKPSLSMDELACTLMEQEMV
jgi:hypothetical protein